MSLSWRRYWVWDGDLAHIEDPRGVPRSDDVDLLGLSITQGV